MIPVARGVGIVPMSDTGEEALVFGTVWTVTFPDSVLVVGALDIVVSDGCEVGANDPNKTPADVDVIGGGPLLKAVPGASVKDPPPDDADR